MIIKSNEKFNISIVYTGVSYVVVDGDIKRTYDFEIDANRVYGMVLSAAIYRDARAAGLDEIWAAKVANGDSTLAAALGDIDTTAESDQMEWEMMTPEEFGENEESEMPLAVFLAGGWADYEYQQAKQNALYAY